MKKPQFDIEIDKLTRSIENAITGDSFKTEVVPLTKTDLRDMILSEWLFDWKIELKDSTKQVYKLVIEENGSIIQGFISLEDKGDHFFMHLIESNKFNKGIKKVYLGVAGNLVAFACRQSLSAGYGGYVSFEAKARLIKHYEKTLGAKVLFGNYMVIDTIASSQLITQYFPDFS